jgi:hypothetical protein
VADTKGISTVAKFEYTVGTHYFLKDIKMEDINPTLHDEYAIDNCTLNPRETLISIGKRVCIHTGFHSYIGDINVYNGITSYARINMKCIIPTGATYYINDYEYVSDQLIITNIIKK